MSKYFDVHSHIHDHYYDDDRGDVLARMRQVSVSTIAVGTDKETSTKAVMLAEKESDVFAAVGIHPTNTEEIFDESFYLNLMKSKKVVAIGECGLDYFRLENEVDVAAEKNRQKEIFAAQLKLATTLNKPLMVHCRPSGKSMDAHEDLIEILKSSHSGTERPRGNIHFFAGTIDIAQKYFDLGLTVSFSGVITFTSEYDELIKFAPLEMIFAETDSPFATPVPYRGKRNEPAYVTEVLFKIAKIKGLEIEAAAQTIRQNVIRVFGVQS